MRRAGFVALALGACAGGGGGGGGAGGGTVSDTCVALLECVATVATESSGAAQDDYGSASDCWTSDAAAESCTAGCQTALEDYHAQHPTEPACDDGVTVGSNVLFPSGARFRFTSAVAFEQCDADVRVSLVDVQLGSDVTPTFTWAGELHGAVGNTGFQSTYASDCDLDGLVWTCTDDPATVDLGDGRTLGGFGLEGRFSDDTASATATLSYTLDGADGACLQTQDLSGAQPS